MVQTTGTVRARFRKKTGFFDIVVDIDETTMKIVTFIDKT
jgi:hypothetical protein